jgi:hypothetical protein
MKSRKLKSEKGVVLLLVVVSILIIAILGFSVLHLAGTEIILTQKAVNKTKAFYTAEAGLEYGVAMLNKLSREQRQALYYDGDIFENSQIPLPTVEGFTFDVLTIEKVGDIETKVVDSGPYKGLMASIQKYKITSQATSDSSDAISAKLVQWIEYQGFHLFQFAAFYEQDLELHPGPTMTISGRIHSNHDIYLTAGSTLSIDSYLTSCSNIYDHRKPGDPGTGTVEIKDADGYYQNMYFDSTDPDWANKALETWGGQVKSQVHGIPTIELPLSVGAEPIDIIKRGNAGDPEELQETRLYHQADLLIIDGVAYDSSGSVVDLTYDKDGVSVNPVDTSKTFYNYREGKDIRVTEIDILKLTESGKLPSNGILYVSTHSAGASEQDGVRLVNGSTLPSQGLTLATDNPLYIQGDYNLNKAPSSVLCDAINVLSNSWQDVDTWQIATDTEVNTSFVAGHTQTIDSDYGGGVENFPRFLENWSGITYTMIGSMTSLWFSEIATGQWLYGQPYYQAPVRVWGFEGISDLSILPPGTPIVYTTHRSSWQQL